MVISTCFCRESVVRMDLTYVVRYRRWRWRALQSECVYSVCRSQGPIITDKNFSWSPSAVVSLSQQNINMAAIVFHNILLSFVSSRKPLQKAGFEKSGSQFLQVRCVVVGSRSFISLHYSDVHLGIDVRRGLLKTLNFINSFQIISIYAK